MKQGAKEHAAALCSLAGCFAPREALRGGSVRQTEPAELLDQVEGSLAGVLEERRAHYIAGEE